MDNDPYREAWLSLIESCREIGGRFVELRRVGERGGDGQFSFVFEARDLHSGKKVAVKVFRPDRSGESYRLECFRREARICESLTGKKDILGWVASYSEFQMIMQSGQGLSLPVNFPYFVVELASSDVGQVIEGSHWTLLEKLQAFHCMCRAVQRIHSMRVVHRDIKPSNFLVMPDGSLRLSDFGTARELGSNTPALMPNYLIPPGDIRYTAPEVLALLHDVDPSIAYRGDIFSLGAVLFEMLTGLPLGVQLFDHDFVGSLMGSMANVPRTDRRRVFDQFVAAISAGHPLPSLATTGAKIPPSVLEVLDSLYMSLAAIDYRQRLSDFEYVFLKLRVCMIIIQNEEKYRIWKANRGKYRANRQKKALKRTMMTAPLRNGNGASE